MDVSVGSRWEDFVTALVEQGRYGSASDVVQEGLRLVEKREAKLADLKATIDASLAEGGSFSDAEVRAAIRTKAEEMKALGF